MIGQHTQLHERRNLHAIVGHQVSKRTPTLSASANTQTPNLEAVAKDTPTPNSSGATPPGASDSSSSSSAQYVKLQDSFLRYSSNAERTVKLFAASGDALSATVLRKQLPELWQQCVDSEVKRKWMCEPCRPWRFSWSLDTKGSSAPALGQAVCFGRAMLEELARVKKLDYVAEWAPLPSS